MDKHNTLGGFEAIMDSFVPKSMDELNNTPQENIENNEDDIEPGDGKINDPVVAKMKADKNIKPKSEEVAKDNEDEIEDLNLNKQEENDGPKHNTKSTENNENNEAEVVSSFFGALADKLGWDIAEDEEVPQNVESLISYFQDVIEESSKPEYASDEIQKLDEFVKNGGELKDYLTIEKELNIDELDMDEEENQKYVVKALLKAKGFSEKQIDKKISKYEDAGLLEDEAEDAVEDLKQIREEQKEQLLAQQKKQYAEYQKRQQTFYNNVVDEIKGLDNIRGISIPEKDKRVLINYILKPDADGKTQYQKDYAKGGVKNLIESAYFTMNADKLLEAAKRAGNNSAIDKLKRSLNSTSINSRSKQINRNSDDSTVWDSFTRHIRISQ